MTSSDSAFFEITDGRVQARIARRGAELQSLRRADGLELLWQGDSQWWGWHAPNLFPIIGALKDDLLIHQGQAYPLARHGFLRQTEAEQVEVEAAAVHCHFRDSPATRAHYPFAFALTISFTLADGRLEQSFTLSNPGDQPLSAAIGGHPAFRWPLTDQAPRAAHRVVFAEAEPAPIRRLDGALLAAATVPTPVEGQTLALDDRLFLNDALIFDQHRSRSLVYGVAGGPEIEVDFADFPHLGLWTKPGAPFFCIEPWQGHASPADFAGEFTDKPGNAILAPGTSRSWRLGIRPR